MQNGTIGTSKAVLCHLYFNAKQTNCKRQNYQLERLQLSHIGKENCGTAPKKRRRHRRLSLHAVEFIQEEHVSIQ